MYACNPCKGGGGGSCVLWRFMLSLYSWEHWENILKYLCLVGKAGGTFINCW